MANADGHWVESETGKSPSSPEPPPSSNSVPSSHTLPSEAYRALQHLPVIELTGQHLTQFVTQTPTHQIGGALRILVLDHNDLTDLSFLNHGMTRLVQLSCQHNRIESLARVLPFLSRVPTLARLDLQGNPVATALPEYGQAICAAAPQVQWLDGETLTWARLPPVRTPTIASEATSYARDEFDPYEEDTSTVGTHTTSRPHHDDDQEDRTLMRMSIAALRDLVHLQEAALAEDPTLGAQRLRRWRNKLYELLLQAQIAKMGRKKDEAQLQQAKQALHRADQVIAMANSKIELASLERQRVELAYRGAARGRDDAIGMLNHQAQSTQAYADLLEPLVAFAATQHAFVQSILSKTDNLLERLTMVECDAATVRESCAQRMEEQAQARVEAALATVREQVQLQQAETHVNGEQERMELSTALEERNAECERLQKNLSVASRRETQLTKTVATAEAAAQTAELQAERATRALEDSHARTEALERALKSHNASENQLSARLAAAREDARREFGAMSLELDNAARQKDSRIDELVRERDRLRDHVARLVSERAAADAAVTMSLLKEKPAQHMERKRPEVSHEAPREVMAVVDDDGAEDASVVTQSARLSRVARLSKELLQDW